jgi:hypothetical protein
MFFSPVVSTLNFDSYRSCQIVFNLQDFGCFMAVLLRQFDEKKSQTQYQLFATCFLEGEGGRVGKGVAKLVTESLLLPSYLI